jgi:hypothetical protein
MGAARSSVERNCGDECAIILMVMDRGTSDLSVGDK